MGKITKYRIACDENFAAKYEFCPKDKTRLQFLDLEYSKQHLEYDKQRFALRREQIAFTIASICLLGLTGTNVYFNANADSFSNVSGISVTFFNNLTLLAFFGFVTNSQTVTKAVVAAIANLSLRQEIIKAESHSENKGETDGKS